MITRFSRICSSGSKHSTPSQVPVILQHSKNLVEGAERVRMADMLGWPSDFQGWSRLLDWLFPIAPSLPARLVPSIVELFGVWQNFFAIISDPGSSKILSHMQQTG